MVYLLHVDCAENDLSEWIEIPSSSEVATADDLSTDVTSKSASAADVSGLVAAWQKSHKKKTDRRMTYPACSAHSVVSSTDSSAIEVLFKL